MRLLSRTVCALMSISLLTSCCLDYSPSFDPCSTHVQFQLYSAQDSIVDSIVNIENNEAIRSSYPFSGCFSDSGYCVYDLPLDPSRQHSGFVFYYSSRPNDTLIIIHQYEEAYTKCRGDYFKKKYASLLRSTFSDITSENHSECLTISAHL